MDLQIATGAIVALACAAIGLAAAGDGEGAEAKERAAGDDAKLVEPFWLSSVMREESLLFVQQEAGKPASANLLFMPDRILSVTSADRQSVYEQGRDFLVQPGSRVLTLTPQSRITFKTVAELYPPKDSPHSIRERRDGSSSLLFSEGSFFHHLQVVVTYDHAPGQWKGPVPAFAADRLPRTLARLRRGQPLTLALSGDSISAGANASKQINASPFIPSYPELLAAGLERAYGSRVTLKNRSVGGWNSAKGAADAASLAVEKPDLVIIAYGMNDVGCRRPDQYRDNIAAIIRTVRQANPQAEFILVSSMLGNSEWSPLAPEMFGPYRDQLAALCGEGIVLADMTALWEELLKTKKFLDLTGNGVNHPNDFGHRLYAQTLLYLLVEQK